MSLAESSPRKVSTRTHAVNRRPTAKEDRQEHRRLMGGKWVKMEIKMFIREFVDGETVERLKPYRKDTNPFKDMPPEGTVETKMYKAFVDSLNEWGLEGYRAVVTDKTPDGGDKSKQRPDVGLFRQEEVPENSSPAWHDQVLHFEFKSTSVEDDPFNDDEKVGDFEYVSDKREDNRGQFISYSAKQFECQQRCFVFSVGIFGHCARLFRWDRSGAIVTNSFDYTITRHLCDFLHQFSQLSLQMQGYDPTAIPIAKDSPEADLMREMGKAIEDEKCGHIRRYFKAALNKKWPWYKLTVNGPVSNPSDTPASDNERQNETREYLVGKPHFITDSVVGRGTRGYVALDCTIKQFVWLKDAWRVDHERIKQEGDILQVLNDLEIKNVPTVLHHGDVLDQRTVSPKYGPQTDPSLENKDGLEEEEGPRSKRKGPKPLKWHRHYRLIVKEVCRPLHDFENGKELLILLWHCLGAHKDVMEIAGLLHRDLSSGNLMLYEYVRDGKVYRDGMLCDWELSKAVPKEDMTKDEGPRQPDRTGTWQFMSVHALNNASWPITIQDELESFFYVLLWFSIRYLHHSISDVGEFMHDYFDEGRSADGDWKSGAQKQASMQAGVIMDGDTQLKFKVSDIDSSGSHPLNNVINGMLPWFKAYYGTVRHSANIRMNNNLPDLPIGQATFGVPDDLAQNAAFSFRRAIEFDDSTAEALAKQHNEAEQNRQAEDKTVVQNLASHKATSALWGSTIGLWRWPENDRKVDQVDKDFKAGEQKEGKGKLKRSATAESGAALMADGPTCRAREKGQKGKSKRRATIEPEGSEEYIPGRKTRAMTAKGKSKRRAPTESESSEDEEFEDEESQGEESQGEGSQDEVSQDDAVGSRPLANIAKRTSKRPAAFDPVHSATTARLRTRVAIAPAELKDVDDVPGHKRTNARMGRMRHHATPESEELEDESEEPTEQSAGPNAWKGKLKRAAGYESEGVEEVASGPSTRSMGRPKLPTISKPANSTARQYAHTAAGVSRSQRGATPELVSNATRLRTRANAGMSRSRSFAAPEQMNNATRPRTRISVGTSRSKRPSPEPEDNDDAPKSKRTRRA